MAGSIPLRFIPPLRKEVQRRFKALLFAVSSGRKAQYEEALRLLTKPSLREEEWEKVQRALSFGYRKPREEELATALDYYRHNQIKNLLFHVLYTLVDVEELVEELERRAESREGLKLLSPSSSHERPTGNLQRALLRKAL